MKPDVVFFGDNVPSDRSAITNDVVMIGSSKFNNIIIDYSRKVDQTDALLVVGSSLEVYSAYRLVDRASKWNAPIAIINYGQTRAERNSLSSIKYKCSSNCASLLKSLSKYLRM
jgi:NAD-dependent deacetylase sirtuin 4